MTNSLLQINKSFPQDIYDIYNFTLQNEQSYVDLIVDSIDYQIYTIMNSGNANSYISPAGSYMFSYDTTEWIGSYDTFVQSRVTDQVIKYFRSRGIRVYIKNDIYINYNIPIYLAGSFNTQAANINVLTVEWFVREDNEYMKTYC